MNSLSTIGFFTCVVGSGWLVWKAFEEKYVAAKKAGGPEWLRVERITSLSIIGGSFVGGVGLAFLLMWLER